MKILVVQPHSYPENVLKQLKELGNVEVKELNYGQLKKEVVDADVLLVHALNKIDKKIIDSGKVLKVIGTATAGVDHIDVDYARSKGIKVISALGQNARAVAEFTIGLMVSLIRNIPQSFDSVKSGNWNMFITGKELEGKILGVIGLGRIGFEVAKIAKHLGMIVIGYDPYIPEERVRELGIKLKNLEELLKSSDVISLHIPLNKETENMISENEFKLMKDGVYIINTARGKIIDEQALVEALRTKVAGYATDVMWEEPPRKSLLLEVVKSGELKNVIITSHIAHSTEEAIERCGLYVVKEIIKLLK